MAKNGNGIKNKINVSISPIFYEQSFSVLQFVFVVFWQREIDKKLYVRFW